MDPILVSFMHDPVIFTLGLILSLGLVFYKKAMVLFKTGKNILSVGRFGKAVVHAGETPAFFVSSNLIKKESIMTDPVVIGIKDTSEAIVALDAVIFDIVQALKGVGTLSEKMAKLFSSLLADKDMQAKFIMGVEGYSNISVEFKNLDAEKTLQLIGYCLPLLAKYFKKTAVV